MSPPPDTTPRPGSLPQAPLLSRELAAAMEAELTGGYEREIAAEQDREREQYFDGWPA